MIKLLHLVMALPLALIISCSSSQKKLNKAEILYNMGTNYLIKKQYSQALKSFLDALEMAPDDPRIHNNLGMAYYFKKDKKRAKEHIIKSIEIKPQDSDARNNLASIYLEENKLTLAEEQYKKILKDLTYLSQFRTYYNLGLVELRRGNNNKAKNYFTKATEEDINYCPAHYQLGLLNYNKDNYKVALQNFKDGSMGRCYNLPESQYYYALTLMKLQKNEQALDKFEKIASRFQGQEIAKKARRLMNNLKRKISNPVYKDNLSVTKRKIDKPERIL
ncbi:MAG: tetratricopeptide repeat protein, partial [bacterium]